MSRRWYTADWHLGSSFLLNDKLMMGYARPFKTVEEMNYTILCNACKQVEKDDMIIHIGDLATYKSDRGEEGLDCNPMDIIKKIPCTFINIRGNHDNRNRVKSLCDCMRTSLGHTFPSVSISHYPSFDKKATNQFLPGDIHLSGHTHGKWKHCLDLTNQVLNICMSVDVWNYKLVSEDELIRYIEKVIKLPPEKMNKTSMKGEK